ncbi:MAG: hypothetical protein ABH823_05915 [bacterium]
MKKIILIAVLFFTLVFLLFCAGPVVAAEEIYPQLAISGYKLWRYNEIDVAPMRNYFSALRDSQFQNFYGPWSEDLQLSIHGALSSDLTVTYDLAQLSGTHEKFSVGVNSHDQQLVMGDQEKLLQDQAYLLQDIPNGLSWSGRWDKFKVNLLATGRYIGTSSFTNEAWKIYRSPDYFGENGWPAYYRDNPYLEYLGFSLGRVDIESESLTVKIGTKVLLRGTDFLFDQVGGLVLIPRSSRRDEPVRVSYRSTNGTTEEKTFTFDADARRSAFASPDFRIVNGSEIITVDNVRLEDGQDYRANYNLGLFVLNHPVAEDAIVTLNYEYTCGPGLAASETITGRTGISISLAYDLLAVDSAHVIKNGTTLTENTDYLISYSTGTITMATILTAADTLEVSYLYYGINKAATAYNFEYDLTPGNRVGASLVNIASDSTYSSTKNNLPTSQYNIWNVYQRLVIGNNSFINTEIAGSTGDLTLSGISTSESDAALKVEAGTRLGSLILNGNYQKTGPKFASVRKVKSTNDWHDESAAVSAKYLVNQNLSFDGGLKSAVTQTGGVSWETNISTFFIGSDYRPINAWDLRYEYRSRDEQGRNSNGRQTNSQIYSNWDLRVLVPIVRSFSDSSNLYCKFLVSRGSGEVSSLGISAGSYDRTEIGWLNVYPLGCSTFVDYLSEQIGDAVGVSYNRSTPYLKVSYPWVFGAEHSLEFYYDVSTAKEEGATVNNQKNIQGYGLTYNLPIDDNAVLSRIQFSSYLQSVDYTDRNNFANAYRSNTINFNGTMVF